MEQPTKSDQKKIFVISPIGKVDENGFDFTELFLEEIVKPAAKAAGGFSVPVRADEVRAPGSITAKVVNDIVEADVCVADLTGLNPNVMYEVGIAHAANRPVILLQQEEGGPPFDFTDERVIHYTPRADNANKAKSLLIDFLRNADHEKEHPKLEKTLHPVRQIFKELHTRADATEPQQAILESLDRLSAQVAKLESQVSTVSSLERSKLRHPSRRFVSDIWFLDSTVSRASAFLDEETVSRLRSNIERGTPDTGSFRKIDELLKEHGRARSREERETIEIAIKSVARQIPPL